MRKRLLLLFLILGVLFLASCINNGNEYAAYPEHLHTLVHIASKSPSCDDDGNIEHWRCNVCEKIFSDSYGINIITDTSIKKLSHNFGGGNRCATCGDLMPTEGLSYELINDGLAYAITGIGSAKGSDIIIPEEYNELPIEIISENAFSGCNITNVMIYDNIKSIGKKAFANCINLEGVTIPDSVTEIGEEAFAGCTNLKRVTIPNTVLSIGKCAFSGCSSLESITLPFASENKNTLSDIYQYPFGYIFGRTECIGCEPTEQYYYSSETSSSELTTYYIPSSLKAVTVISGDIPYGAFRNCKNIETVVMEEDVKNIEVEAFYGCTNLEKITLCKGLTKIGVAAFSGCIGLKSITIPDTVAFIGGYAFADCINLESIEFSDTFGWHRTTSSSKCNNKTGGSLINVESPTKNALNFKETYDYYYWYKIFITE